MRFLTTSTTLLSLSGVIGLANIPGVYGWGAAGHEIVATIAQIYLHPAVLADVCSILYPGSSANSSSNEPPCYISKVATWADQVRRSPQYRYTGVLHYIGAKDDHPSSTCAFPGSSGWAGKTNENVLGAIRNMSSILDGYIYGVVENNRAEEALKFLVHFLGDMHQPLHLTGRERGGNGVKVTFDGRLTNLHSLWDGYLIAKALRTIPKNYSQPLSSIGSPVDVESHLFGAIYDPYIRRIMHEGFGIGLSDASTSGRFASEYQDWLSCPEQPSPSFYQSLAVFIRNIRSLLQSFAGPLGGGRHISEAVSSLVDMIIKFGKPRSSQRRVGNDEGRWDNEVLCPYAWAKDLHKLNCEFPLWPRELDQGGSHEAFAAIEEEDEDEEHTHDYLDAENEVLEAWLQQQRAETLNAAQRPPSPHPDLLELDTPEYAGRISEEWLVERLVAMAGIRLAGLLNALFLPPDLLPHTSPTLPVISLW
ncbi:S1/P1 nuclease-domain-containing protein [Abortiporus biennis]|nr:S1/P1 nuclease-domain-containing protein [Abortiporus biennis]